MRRLGISLSFAFLGFAVLETGIFLIYRPLCLVLLGVILIGVGRAGMKTAK